MDTFKLIQMDHIIGIAGKIITEEISKIRVIHSKKAPTSVMHMRKIHQEIKIYNRLLLVG